MVSATVKVLSLLSGMMIISTRLSLLHVMSAVTVKLDGAPAIKCMHSDITVQFTAYACTCTHRDPRTHWRTRWYSLQSLHCVTSPWLISWYHLYWQQYIPTAHTVSAQMLTFEHCTCHGLAELYTPAALNQHFDSRSNGDHELLHSPYKYTLIGVMKH